MNISRRPTKGCTAVLVSVALAASAWAADITPPPWRGQAGTTHQEWLFDSRANPASPNLIENPYGTASAAITLGEFATGWLYQTPGLGTQTGYWDLGATGASIVIDIDNQPVSFPRKEVWVQVTSFVDITQPPLVAVPGGSLLTQQERVVEHVSTGGDWWSDLSRWSIEPSPAHEQVIFTTYPSWGAVIDQIVVDTVSFACNGQDADGDGDVDLMDFSVFQSCFNGPNRLYAVGDLACLCFDADADADVDLDDFAVFQSCFNGPNRAPACP